MMSVEEYAQDVNYSVSQILKKCNQLGITPTDIKTLSYEEQNILEDWNDVFTYTEFDPNLES